MRWVDDDTIALHWTTDDVIHQCDQITTKEQAREVLSYVLNKHDACYGVSWDTLDIVADMLYPKEKGDTNGNTRNN
jgi:hypothetical protein